ncbi:MAG: hypothetical protein HQK77_06335 [Desulfobacterales bacterium]|nr:hypothetical protein [Desulfobacterales bacterium]
MGKISAPKSASKKKKTTTKKETTKTPSRKSKDIQKETIESAITDDIIQPEPEEILFRSFGNWQPEQLYKIEHEEFTFGMNISVNSQTDNTSLDIQEFLFRQFPETIPQDIIDNTIIAFNTSKKTKSESQPTTEIVAQSVVENVDPEPVKITDVSAPEVFEAAPQPTTEIVAQSVVENVDPEPVKVTDVSAPEVSEPAPQPTAEIVVEPVVENVDPEPVKVTDVSAPEVSEPAPQPTAEIVVEPVVENVDPEPVKVTDVSAPEVSEPAPQPTAEIVVEPVVENVDPEPAKVTDVSAPEVSEPAPQPQLHVQAVLESPKADEIKCENKVAVKKGYFSNNKMEVFLISIFIFVIAMIVSASISNRQNYYIKPTDTGIEIWRGNFAPLGEDKMIFLESIKAPDVLKEKYTKKEVYLLICKYYIQQSDSFLAVSVIPDFNRIVKELKVGLSYAIDASQKENILHRLATIDLMVLLYKANAAASTKTPDGYQKALDYLNTALKLNLTDSQNKLINNTISQIQSLTAPPVDKQCQIQRQRCINK